MLPDTASRSDIDARKIAYYGFSWGGREGVNFKALEPRFKASILMAAGFDRIQFAPEIDQINFAPHVRVPTLMLNGRDDFRFPYEESQLPMFRALWATDKAHALIKSGHAPRASTSSSPSWSGSTNTSGPCCRQHDARAKAFSTTTTSLVPLP